MIFENKINIIFKIDTEISKDFLILSILFSFFNIDFIDLISDIDLKIIDIDFMDNIIILIYSKNTEENYKILIRLYQDYQ